MKVSSSSSVRLHRAFTMLELMIVCAIMGVILLMSFPSIRSALRKEAFTQAMNDVLDACEFGRKESIIHDTIMEMRIYPHTGIVEVAAVARDVTPDVASSDLNSAPPPVDSEKPAPSAASRTWQIPDGVNIDMLDVNFSEYKDAGVARVRFYPNGTSYELTMVIRSSSGDYRKITLEEVTALADATSQLR